MSTIRKFSSILWQINMLPHVCTMGCGFWFLFCFVFISCYCDGHLGSLPLGYCVQFYNENGRVKIL